jgi:hypothetical protein
MFWHALGLIVTTSFLVAFLRNNPQPALVSAKYIDLPGVTATFCAFAAVVEIFALLLYL